MAQQQEDYYYEIQLTNKQLVFYFMAGATGLILSFLAGVMVGRGVDTEVRAARPGQEDRLVEEPVKPVTPVAEQLRYAEHLDGDKLDDKLQKPAEPVKAVTAPAAQAPAPAVQPAPVVAPPAAAAPPPAATKSSAPPAAGAAKGPAAAPAPKGETVEVRPPAAAPPTAKTATSKAGKTTPTAPAPVVDGFTIQVGAFRDRAAADSVVARLKGRGFAAYVVNPAATDGLFNVRVGQYQNRADAEKTQARLRDEEKFKPFLVHN